MKTIILFVLLACSCQAGLLCSTNYTAQFTWGANSTTGDVMTLYYGSGQQAGQTTYPSTNIAFNISQVRNQTTLYIQGQRGNAVVNCTNSIYFDTNNFPLVWGSPTFNGVTGK